MAFKARCALGAELPVMHLPVAFQAIGRESGEILRGITSLTRAEMAGPAGLFPVHPFQKVARGAMVKGDIIPTGISMARQALLIGVILQIQNCGVNVLVTVVALDSDLPEFPALIFSVAVKTGYGQVGAAQGKGSFPVPFDCI
jgi:hypothetical protein